MPPCESKLVSRSSRSQWPRLYLLSRRRCSSRVPGLVGDCCQVLRVLGWALTRINIIGTMLHYPKELKSGCVQNCDVSYLAT